MRGGTGKWIQKARLKKGVFSRQLGILEKEKIPDLLISRIIKSKKNRTITNPSRLGRKRIKITTLLKKRANLVRNLKRIAERRKK